MPVGYAASLCSCGNSAGLTCQLCNVGMCTDCNVLSRPPADLDGWPVRVAGFGYLKRAWDYRYRYLNLDHRDSGTYGPFLYLNELLSSLASAHGLRHRNGADGLRHLCWPCLYTAVPDTVERLAAGLMCETPTCVNQPCQRCRCCDGAFCEACLMTIRARGPVPCQITWTEPGGQVSRDGEVLPIIGATIDRSVVPAAPRGLCAICISERHHRQRELAEEIVGERYSGLLVPVPPTAGESTAVFRLPAIRRWTSRSRQRERARARAVLEQCVADIAGQLARIPAAPCLRARAFTQGQDYAYYLLLDERGRRPRTTAPTW